MGIIDQIPRLSPEMSSRKLQVLKFIQLFHAEYGVGPSLREIAAGCGTHRNRVQEAIRTLAAEGRVVHQPGVTRGVRPIGAVEQLLQLEGVPFLDVITDDD